jgi:hypothetical protein
LLVKEIGAVFSYGLSVWGLMAWVNKDGGVMHAGNLHWMSYAWRLMNRMEFDHAHSYFF